MNYKTDSNYIDFNEDRCYNLCEVNTAEVKKCSFTPMDDEAKTSTEKESSVSVASPKKCTKQSPKSLALRADVMNKNIFRALRRECKTIFEDYLKRQNMSLCKSKRTFLVNLDKFVQNVLETKPELKNMLDFDANEFREYIGTLINTCMMRKCLTGTKGVSKIAEVSDILYTYSHKKFYDFLEIKEVKVILELVLEHSAVAGFIQNHEALATHADAYAQHINKIF